jgi:hypothetical protein
MLLARHRLVCTALAAALLLLSGCSGRRAVEGTVKFDGTPVDGGLITFVASSGSDRVTTPIEGGKYSLPSGRGPKSGSHRVEIIWKKKTGRMVDTPGDQGVKMEETVQVIPASYNSGSTQTAEVKSSGNTFNFDIKSR